MNSLAIEAAFRAAENEERAEMNRVVGAVRFLAASDHVTDLRSRLLDVLDGYDRARVKTNKALEAFIDARTAECAGDTGQPGVLGGGVS